MERSILRGPPGTTTQGSVRPRMDWNLIPTLEALLTERSVSRAARRLGLSQPAVSNALARLRRQFGDDLLVRRGSTYVLTPFAEQLAAASRDAVDAVATVAASSTTGFDPATSERRFTLAASDYVQAVLGGDLVAGARRLAPFVSLGFVSPFGAPFGTDEEIVEGTDGWLAPREMLPGHEHVGAASDRWVCVVARDHPGVGHTLTLDDAATYPWVAPTVRGQALQLHLRGLAAQGVEPRVEATTDTFGAVPFLVSGSDRIGFVQLSLARRLAEAASVRVLECPWTVPPLHLTLWWSTKRDGDPGHAWLRDLVRDTLGGRDLAGDPT